MTSSRTPSRHGQPTTDFNCRISRRGGRRKWMPKPGQSVPFIPAREKFGLRWEKVFFKPERNKGRVEQERSGRGSEFQTVGAAKANDRRPLAVRISGTVSKCLSRDLKFLEGM